MKNKFIRIIILLLVAVVIGFLQENLKVNINYLLDKGEAIPGFFDTDAAAKKEQLEKVKINAPFDYYHNHRKLESLLMLSHTQLVMLKWGVTVFFVVVFMFINAFVMKWFTGQTIYFKRTIWLYVLFFLLAFSIYGIGKITGTSVQAYGVSREIVGGLQSLVPLMILIPASWLLMHHNTFVRNEKN